MYDLDRRLVTLLVFDREKLSRNRHFHAFDEPSMRRARRIATHLRAIIRRLNFDPKLTLQVFEEPNERVRLLLTSHDPQVTHTAWMSQEEWSILLMAPVVADRAGLAATPRPNYDSDQT